jgi:hypothetical protein
MTYEQYMDYAEKESAEIERMLERTSETERKVFWSIYDLVTTWRELQFHLSGGIRCESLPETLKRPMAA